MALNFTSLQWRLISAFILIPVVLLIIWTGHYAFAVFLGLVAGLALQELWVMAKRSGHPLVLTILVGFYICISFIFCYSLRQTHGMFPTILFFALMWGSDIGAYFMGKALKGPKMAGEISPNKTWAGYVGALLTPVLILFLVNMRFDPVLIVAGLALGITGQSGDLLVSWLKRYTHVKDTSSLIPGHGGVLDRVDSLMLATPVYLALFKMGYIL